MSKTFFTATAFTYRSQQFIISNLITFLHNVKGNSRCLSAPFSLPDQFADPHHYGPTRDLPT